MLKYELGRIFFGRQIVAAAVAAAEGLRDRGYDPISFTIPTAQNINGMEIPAGSEIFMFKVIASESRSSSQPPPEPQQTLISTPSPEISIDDLAFEKGRAALTPPPADLVRYMDAVYNMESEGIPTPAPNQETYTSANRTGERLFVVGAFDVRPNGRYSSIDFTIWDGSRFEDKHEVLRDYHNIPPFKTKNEGLFWLLQKYTDDLVETMKEILYLPKETKKIDTRGQ